MTQNIPLEVLSSESKFTHAITQPSQSSVPCSEELLRSTQWVNSDGSGKTAQLRMLELTFPLLFAYVIFTYFACYGSYAVEQIRKVFDDNARIIFVSSP